VALAALLVLFLSLRGIAGFYTDYLWFDSLHMRSVWSGLLAAKVMLGLIFTGAFFALLWVNLLVADRIAPRFRPSGPEEELLERYFEMVGRRTGLVRVGVSLLFAIIAGAGVAQQWNNWLLFTHRVDFGQSDPLFNIDIGFYVFQLPFLSFLISWLFAAFVIILIITTVAHYLNGGIRLQTPMQRVTPQVKAHLSVLLGVLALIKAGGYWLQRYELTVAHRGFVNGAGYTDVKAQLPAIMLLLFISLFSCGLFLFNIRRRGWVLPVLAVGLWALVAVVAGSAYPWFIQRFRVLPAESSKEAPYIARNIAATRQAYGLDKVESRDFQATGDLRAEDLTTPAARDTVRNLRLLDPEIVVDTFQKRQADLGWLRFPDKLAVDRYQIDGKPTQVVVGARELNATNLPQKSWEASRLTYTHGYGVVMAPVNELSNTEPAFLVAGLPVTASSRINVNLPDSQARIYYTENQSGYAIVNTKKEEIGYQQESTPYTGQSGVRISSYLRRAAFALRFQDINPLITGSITGESRLLWVRDISQRIQKVAPFLELDSNPYPVVVNGRVLYIVDAYTTSNRYPYSEQAPSSGLASASGLRHSFNYVRNSVKAVVDAYDGSVNLYLNPGLDGQIDPIIRSYQKAFPKLFKSQDQIPKELSELRDHFRHPEDMYRVQTTVWGRYHIDKPDAFYSGTRQWVVAQRPPRDVTAAAAAAARASAAVTVPGQLPPQTERVPPLYTLMTLPGGDPNAPNPALDYVALRTFVPVSQDNAKQELTGFMAAKPNGSLVVYNTPQDVPGPSLVSSSILSNQEISQQVTLLGQAGSKVEFGNLLPVPINKSLLYVLPLYVSATGDNQVPKLNSVVVSYKQQIVKAPNVQDALLAIVNGASGGTGTTVVPPPSGGTTSTAQPSPTTTASPGSPTTAAPPTTVPGPVTAQDLASRAAAAFDAADKALRNGDLAGYKAKVDEAKALVQQMIAQTGAPASSTTTSTPPTTAKPAGA
jgi:uncharacterized membrane protein (UPF0182 family)